MTTDHELLIGLSEGELEALSEGLLAPAAQSRLNGLLERNSEGTLEVLELQELDQLLAKVDQLNILKSRAAYTLAQGTGTARE